MIRDSQVFGFGELYASEIRRLITSGSINPHEAAALTAQIDALCELGGEVNQQQHNSSGLLRALTHLGDHERIVAMLARKFSPVIVIAIRNRRFGTYCCLRRLAQDEFLSDSLNMCKQYASAREWPMYLKEKKRRIAARFLFAELYWAGLRYRFGFRPDVKALTRRIAELAVGLPHRNDCLA